MAPRIISRREAGLLLPKQFSGWMKLPAPRVWFHHTVTPDYLGDIPAGMREIQKIAFGRGFFDVSYSWMFFLDGTIGEGRGWGVVGAHTLGDNTGSHGFVFVGNYENLVPTPAQLASARWLLDEGIRTGKIRADVQPTGGHRDRIATACPGKHVYARIPDVRAGTLLPAPNPAPQPSPQPVPVRDTFKEKVMANPVLKVGASGHYVSILQALLGVHARDLTGDLNRFVDGDFGENTERVLRTWQARTKALSADGICGPATWAWLVGV